MAIFHCEFSIVDVGSATCSIRYVAVVFHANGSIYHVKLALIKINTTTLLRSMVADNGCFCIFNQKLALIDISSCASLGSVVADGSRCFSTVDLDGFIGINTYIKATAIVNCIVFSDCTASDFNRAAIHIKATTMIGCLVVGNEATMYEQVAFTTSYYTLKIACDADATAVSASYVRLSLGADHGIVIDVYIAIGHIDTTAVGS